MFRFIFVFDSVCVALQDNMKESWKSNQKWHPKQWSPRKIWCFLLTSPSRWRYTTPERPFSSRFTSIHLPTRNKGGDSSISCDCEGREPDFKGSSHYTIQHEWLKNVCESVVGDSIEISKRILKYYAMR